MAGPLLGAREIELVRAILASDDHLLPPVGELTNAVEIVASAQPVGKVVA